MARKYSELHRKMPPEDRGEARRRAQAMLADMERKPGWQQSVSQDRPPSDDGKATTAAPTMQNSG